MGPPEENELLRQKIHQWSVPASAGRIVNQTRGDPRIALQVFRFLELMGPERTLINVPERTVHFALRPPSFGQYLHESSRALSIRLITRTIGSNSTQAALNNPRKLVTCQKILQCKHFNTLEKVQKVFFFSHLTNRFFFPCSFSLFFFHRKILDVVWMSPFFLYFPLCRDFVGIICRHFSTVYLSFIIVHVNSRGCCVLRLSLTRYIIIIL